MQDKTTSQAPPADATPDSLLDAFKGRGLKSIILFTIMIHVIVLGGSSVPYLIRTLSPGTADLSEDERIKMAVEEATPVLREIADKYELNPQQLSSQFAGGGSRTTKVAEQLPDTAAAPDDATDAAGATNPGDTDGPDTTEPERPKSALEKELDVKLEGPKQPSLDDEKDIF